MQHRTIYSRRVTAFLLTTRRIFFCRTKSPASVRRRDTGKKATSDHSLNLQAREKVVAQLEESEIRFLGASSLLALDLKRVWAAPSANSFTRLWYFFGNKTFNCLFTQTTWWFNLSSGTVVDFSNFSHYICKMYFQYQTNEIFEIRRICVTIITKLKLNTILRVGISLYIFFSFWIISHILKLQTFLKRGL